MSEMKKEILFSRSIKAGRRVYYIDVKMDKNSEYYLSITESKRIKEGTEFDKPVFEKHKIFLYREDLTKFNDTLQEALNFVDERAGLPERQEYKPAEPAEPTPEEEPIEEDEFKIDIEF